MKIKNPIKEIKTFFDKRIKWLESGMDKETKELHQLEQDLKKEIDSIEKTKDGWSDKKIIKFWIFWLLIALVWYFVFDLLNIIFLIIGAYIVSMIVEWLVLWFQKFKLDRWWAVIFAYIVFIVFLLWLLVFVVPFLLSQMSELISVWINYVSVLQQDLATKGIINVIMDMHWIPTYFKEYFITNLAWSDLVVQLQNTVEQNLSEIVSVWKQYVQLLWVVVINFVSWFANFIVDFWLFITLAILFSIEKELVMKFLANMSGSSNYDLMYLKLEKMYKKLSIWLKARLALSLFVWLAMWVCLLIMSAFWVEIPNKFWISILTGLLDIIPYIWPFISGALLFIVWLLYNTIIVAILAVWILFGVNLVQNNILTPIFMNKALWVSSVLILISMVIGWMIMWFLWVLLAVPIAVIITLLFQDKNKIVQWDKEMDMLSIIKKKTMKKKNKK